MTFPLHTGDRTATIGAEWTVWDDRCRLVVTDPWSLRDARQVLERRLAVADKVVNPRRAGAVVRRLLREGGWPHTERGDTRFGPQPTAADPFGIGPFPYGLALASDGAPAHVLSATRHAATAPSRRRRRDVLCVGQGSTATAWTAQQCAESVAEATRCGVLVAIGDDVATSGLAPVGGWRVALDPAVPGGEPLVVALDGGAISHVRTDRPGRLRDTDRPGRLRDTDRLRGARDLEPRTLVVASTGRTMRPVWRAVTVAAANGPAASAACRGALLRGTAGPGWLADLGLAARLVAVDGTVAVVGRWPLAG